MTYAHWCTVHNISLCALIYMLCAGFTHADIAIAPRTDNKFSCDKVEVVPQKIMPTVKPMAPLLPVVQATSLDADKIFQMVNDHRSSLGLPAFQKDESLCKIGQERGPELYNEIFVTGNIHGGFNARNLPYWATENMKYGVTEQEIYEWWMNSQLHRSAIESSATYSCVTCHGNICIELFTSYIPK